MKYFFKERKKLSYIRGHIIDLCDKYLAYIKDEHIISIFHDQIDSYSIHSSSSKIEVISIMITKKNNDEIIEFKWSDIKYDFLTFHDILQNKNVINVEINGTTKLKPSELENIRDDMSLNNIKIIIGL